MSADEYLVRCPAGLAKTVLDRDRMAETCVFGDEASKEWYDTVAVTAGSSVDGDLAV